MSTNEDCTSVGFTGEGRCIEEAVVNRMEADGQHRVCFEHFTAETVTYAEDDFDPTPCCPDPGCPGSPRKPGSCTFPGYADNH